MRSLRTSVLALIAALVLAAAAAGDSRTTTLIARIPFEFTVGEHQYPAGEYEAQLLPAPFNRVLRFGSPNGGARTLSPTLGGTGRGLGNRTSMDFRLYRYRDSSGVAREAYFLFRINAGRGYAARDLPMSYSEQAVEREARIRPMSSTAATVQRHLPRVVAVAAAVR